MQVERALGKTMEEYPECKKMRAVRDEHMLLTEFADWLRHKGIFLARYQDDDNYLQPEKENVGNLAAEFLGIDVNTLSKEREEIYKRIV